MSRRRLFQSKSRAKAELQQAFVVCACNGEILGRLVFARSGVGTLDLTGSGSECDRLAAAWSAVEAMGTLELATTIDDKAAGRREYVSRTCARGEKEFPWAVARFLESRYGFGVRRIFG
jgi:hypothetical protein